MIIMYNIKLVRAMKGHECSKLSTALTTLTLHSLPKEIEIQNFFLSIIRICIPNQQNIKLHELIFKKIDCIGTV